MTISSLLTPERPLWITGDNPGAGSECAGYPADSHTPPPLPRPVPAEIVRLWITGDNAGIIPNRCAPVQEALQRKARGLLELWEDAANTPSNGRSGVLWGVAAGQGVA